MLPPHNARAQGAITVDRETMRRVLADTVLAHDLPARHSERPPDIDMRATRADRAAMTARLAQLTALLRADSAVQHSRGVSLVFRTGIGVDTSSRGRRVSGAVTMTSWPYGVFEGTLQYYSASTVNLQVNPDLCPAEEKTYAVGFRRAPKRNGRFHGFPMLDSVVVITRRTAPPCLPVSRARVMGALQKQLADLNGRMATGAVGEERAEAINAVLAQMSPAERSSDAWLSAKGCELLVCFTTADEEDAEQLVIPNPDFYDASRPTAVQAVTLPLAQLLHQSNPRNEFQERFIRAVLATFDWAALNALVQ